MYDPGKWAVFILDSSQIHPLAKFLLHILTSILYLNIFCLYAFLSEIYAALHL